MERDWLYMYTRPNQTYSSQYTRRAYALVRFKCNNLRGDRRGTNKLYFVKDDSNNSAFLNYVSFHSIPSNLNAHRSAGYHTIPIQRRSMLVSQSILSHKIAILVILMLLQPNRFVQLGVRSRECALRVRYKCHRP
jgi:hypothetical protein